MKSLKAVKGVGNFFTGGTIDRREAKKREIRGEELEESSQRELEENLHKTQEALESLIKTKMRIEYSRSLSHFKNMYKKIGKIDLKPITGINDFFNHSAYKSKTATMEKLAPVTAKEIGKVALGLNLWGNQHKKVVKKAVYAEAILRGHASTGAKIGNLHGAARNSAVLARLGGGTVKAGSAGVAGGKLVLSKSNVIALVALPVLLGMNNLATKRGKQIRNYAENYSDLVDMNVEDKKRTIEGLLKICEAIKFIDDTLISLDGLFCIKLAEMKSIIQRLDDRPLYYRFLAKLFGKKIRLDSFSEEEKSIIIETVNCAKRICAFRDAPILDEHGNATYSNTALSNDKNYSFLEEILAFSSIENFTKHIRSDKVLEI